MSDVEFDQCDFCKKKTNVERTYLHGCNQKEGEYDGFIIIRHCPKHKPKEVISSEKATALLRETAMRAQIAFPETEQDNKWFDQGFNVKKSPDFITRLFKALDLGKTDDNE